MLGSTKKLVWSQKPEGLVIESPAKMPSQIVVAFKVQ
jgi:hypothetical protein